MDPRQTLTDIDSLATKTAALAAHFRRAGIQWLPKPQIEAVEELAQLLAQLRGPERADSEDDKEAVSAQASAASRSMESPAEKTGQPATRPAPPPSTRPPKRVTLVPAVTAASGSYSSDTLPVVDRERELEQLKAKVANCTRCPALSSGRTHTVFGEGNASPRFAFFGEGPGADEDRTGRPFVGRAGQLLTRMIEACTLKREDVYILNTVKCRPPGNRNPENDEIGNCRPFYQRQLAILRPEYIVCLGSVSARELLQSKLSVGRLRGQLHRYYDSKVLVTYHPAYLLRNPSAKKAAWEDLQLMLRDAGIEVGR